jgi:hypothetical protein
VSERRKPNRNLQRAARAAARREGIPYQRALTQLRSPRVEVSGSDDTAPNVGCLRVLPTVGGSIGL